MGEAEIPLFSHALFRLRLAMAAAAEFVGPENR